MAAKLEYLLDLPVVAELTRPNGNRRILSLFAQRQLLCALAAPTLHALLRGIDSLPDGPRRQHLQAFASELLLCGPTVLPFDREAAIWLAGRSVERLRTQRNWSMLDGQQAAIAATRDLALVTRHASSFAGVAGLRIDDWFRP